MRNVNDTLKKRGAWEGGRLLKGSDLESDSVTVFVHQAKEAPPAWNSPMVLVIDEVQGCKALALNATNVRRLADKISPDPDEWAGYEITFARVRVTNPQTNGPAYGLEVDSVKKTKRKPNVPF